MENKSHFIKCECTCHVLEVERYNYDEHDNGFNFTIWNYSRNGSKIRGWKEKFRWCWNIIKTGNPWADCIIATNNDARGVAKFILENLPKEEYNENK